MFNRYDLPNLDTPAENKRNVSVGIKPHFDLMTRASGALQVNRFAADRILEVALAYLSEMGFQTLEAKDGASALRLIQQHRDIDLIITDIVMGGEANGAELGPRRLNYSWVHKKIDVQPHAMSRFVQTQQVYVVTFAVTSLVNVVS